MQSGIDVRKTSIRGTLKKLSTGPIAEYWGAGHFMALNFTDLVQGNTYKVGLTPSVSSGLVALDEDHNGVFKITDKENQKFTVETTDGNGNTVTQYYDLKALALEG